MEKTGWQRVPGIYQQLKYFDVDILIFEFALINPLRPDSLRSSGLGFRV
jgi:hypothetical protein